MRSVEPIIISPGTHLRDVIRIIDAGGVGMAVVCDSERRLIGIVDDVNIRKGILSGLDLDDAVDAVITRHPIVARHDTSRKDLLEQMHRTGIRHLPIVDHEDRIVGVEILKDLADAGSPHTEVLIMAGGRGQRLRPLTDYVPKPMLPLGDRPILEHLVDHLRQQGFQKFCMILNYKAEIIQKHFGDGSNWGIQIRYILEEGIGGTAGALSLFDPLPAGPFLLLNADLVTDLDFERVVEYHQAHDCDATICVKRFRIDVPFGVVDTVGDKVVAMREKPRKDYHINAGIYVLDPKALAKLEIPAAIDMPDLLRMLLESGATVRCFPIREKWVDIGTPEEYLRIAKQYEEAKT